MAGLEAEVWTYAGVRVSHASKRIHAWLDGKTADEHFYHDSGQYVIGGRYNVEVDRTSEGLSRKLGSYTGERIDAAARAELIARDQAARTRLAGLALERKHGSESALDEALKPLLEIASKLRNQYDRDYLAAMVSRKLQNPRFYI